MAMISAVAYTLWGILLKYNPVGKVAVFGFTNPIFGVILSAVFLGEKNQAFGVQGLVALVLVSVGIFMVNKSKNSYSSAVIHRSFFVCLPLINWAFMPLLEERTVPRRPTYALHEERDLYQIHFYIIVDFLWFDNITCSHT